MRPRFLAFVLGLLSRLFYRLAVVGAGNVPAQGGALLVSNHVATIDLLLILVASPRFVRFLLPQELCERPVLGRALRWLRVIPLPPDQNSRGLAGALGQAREAIRRGEVVGIFAEKHVPRVGLMLPFRHEFEQIVKDSSAPIVPVCLDGLWGSIFSHQKGRFFWKLPRRIPYPVTISFGSPLPSDTAAFAVRSVIQDLHAEAWACRRRFLQPLHRAFIRRARRCPLRLAMSDARVPRLRFGGALMRTIFLARRLRRCWPEPGMVGILLPPSVGGALANFAALLAGQVPVNLNYTLSGEALASCARQCHLTAILTSQAFLDRLKITLPCPPLLLEELAARPRVWERITALALAWLAPIGLIERAAGRRRRASLDDLATVIFSSGSTGEPKGIMLSHYNVISNVEQLGQTFDFGPRDRFLGILPFFHSFGFTATLVVPAALGLGVAYHPNPLEGRAVGELVRRHDLTFLMATPAFLQIYLRSCEPDDFGSLRLVMTGAEKLPEWLATAFEEKFGIRPVEGYGCTECSPVVAANTRDFRAAGLRQIGARRGKIGHPMPGMSVRLVDPETGAPVPLGQAGLLLVRGPNVMQGYLNQPDKTAEVLREGWYRTGDIAALDEDGFLQITDRLSRFSKLGGEMVPHVKVEEKLQELAGAGTAAFVVTGVPDPKKGERLVVLHTLPEDELQVLLKKLPHMDLPNLWIPRPNQFFRVEELPRLASGKMDLRKVRDLATAFSAGPTARQDPPA
jgi:acyl-[acyl-carrier-protein]-phospholipid O-acyltransferase / long-chain-fatty-acid--[acyl-carrier-protein] ligase